MSSARTAALLMLTGAAALLLLYTRQSEEGVYASEPSVQAQGKMLVLPRGAPKPIGPYSPAIRAGDFVFLAGQIGLDPATGEMVEGGIVPQTRQALANLRSLLEAAGLGFDDVVRATVYLADLNDYGTFNGEYATVFGEVPPARVAVEVARLPREARVEISMIAYGPGD